jgi:hypothetical protein
VFVFLLHQAPTLGLIFTIVFGILGFYLPGGCPPLSDRANG